MQVHFQPQALAVNISLSLSTRLTELHERLPSCFHPDRTSVFVGLQAADRVPSDLVPAVIETKTTERSLLQFVDSLPRLWKLRDQQDYACSVIIVSINDWIVNSRCLNLCLSRLLSYIDDGISLSACPFPPKPNLSSLQSMHKNPEYGV